MTFQDDVQAIADAAQLEFGLSVLHVESGEQLDVNGDAPFPMASVFKIPVLAKAGEQIAVGKLNLEDRITLLDESKSAGSGILPYFQAGLMPTVRDLLTLMIIISDNTATDINVELLGGPLAVESYMHELGLKNIFVKMDCKNLLRSLFPPEIQDLPLEEMRAWSNENDIKRDGVTFSRKSDNNVSTAADMTKLVSMLFQGQIVDGVVKDELIDILLKQQFSSRLPRFFPPTVSFAHKTGTIAGTTNDSGVIIINEHNHVVVTLFTVWDDQPYWNRPVDRNQRFFEVESAMGKIGLLAYEKFRDYSA